MTMIKVVLAFALAMSIPVTAQAPEPVLAEIEQVRLENLQLKYTLLNIEKQKLNDWINANHPGYAYDMATGKFAKVK